MAIYLLGGDNVETARAVERKISRLLPELRTVRHLQDIGPVRLKQDEPDFVLLPVPSDDPMQVDRVLELVRRHRDRFFFILISRDLSKADHQRLVFSGHADWVSARASPQDIVNVLARYLPQSMPEPQRRPEPAPASPVQAMASPPPSAQEVMDGLARQLRNGAPDPQPAPEPPPRRPHQPPPAPEAQPRRPRQPSPARFPAQEIMDRLERQLRKSLPDAQVEPQTTPARAGANPSSLVSFVPSAGGVGNTTLVVEAAVQIKANRATRNRRVCVIDLDFQTSHICDHLDIEPRLQIQEIVDDPQRFDDQMFEVFVSRHSSGIDVLAAPRSKTFNAGELRIETLDVLFDKMAARYEYMLADLPVTWFSWTRPVIGASSRMVVTGLNTVPGLRQIAETLAVIRGNAADGQGHIAVAINRCQRRSFNGTALREEHIRRVLGREQILLVREDPAAAESVNAGEPLAIGHSLRKVNKDIAALADFCRGAEPSPSRHTSNLLSKLLNG
jgi:Flp pilus assembly CpaE family ATPase